MIIMNDGGLLGFQQRPSEILMYIETPHYQG